jgi:hypothetical protein
MKPKSSRGILPQDNLYRAVYALPSASEDVANERAVTQNDDGTTLDLQWAVFDQWTEINSAYEGHFMERIAPGAFAKTIKENQSNMRILLQHGRDPQIGNKPIASITEVGENNIGGYGRGELFPGLDPLVVDGLRAGQYGSSFRFGVIRDDLVTKPERSAYNPKGIPERTIREASVMEFGPVTWGAYSQATAGVRSITDEIHFASLTSIPEARLLELVAFARGKAERLDSLDFSCLSSMVLAGGRYIAQQDEDDPESNTTTMNQVLDLLGTLVQVEIAEAPEPDDTSAEYLYSAPESGDTADAAPAADDSRRTEVPEAPVEAPAAKATPTTDRYLSKRPRPEAWRI